MPTREFKAFEASSVNISTVAAVKRARDQLEISQLCQRASFAAGLASGQNELRYSTRRFSTADIPVVSPGQLLIFSAPFSGYLLGVELDSQK